MKCPKCHYVSYDSPDRCRNCGFDFSLLVEEPPIRPDAAEGAFADLDLRPPLAGPTPAPGEMPLFQDPAGGLGDAPLIRKPAPPRVPLAVRRSPDAGRPRAGHAAVVTPPQPGGEASRRHERSAPASTPDLAFDDDPLLGVEPDAPAPVVVPPPRSETHRDAPRRNDGEAAAQEPAAAAPLRRLAAGAVDVTVLGLIDLAVVHLTLKVLGLDWSAVLDLRWAPMLGFFAVLDGGYFVAFTTSAGQTIGKMLAGIRVVTREGGRVPLATAIVRTAAMLVSLAPLGLGWAPAFVSRGMPALHDRLAGTRVVPF